MDFWQISNILGLAMSFVAILLSIRGIMLCNKQIKDSEARIKRFDKSFFEKGEDVVMPGAPPEDMTRFDIRHKGMTRDELSNYSTASDVLPRFFNHDRYYAYTSKVMSGEIDPSKVSLMDFYTNAELCDTSIPYIANAENLQPGTAENEAEILHDVDTEIKRSIKKRVTENSTTVETREGAPPLPPITQPIVQFRDGVHSKVPPHPPLKSKKPINEY